MPLLNSSLDYCQTPPPLCQFFSDTFFGYLQKTAKLKMLTGCPKNFFSDFFSRFWKSLNIPTKWCLNHSSSSIIRKVMTLWTLKIWEVEKKIFYPPFKKGSKRGVKIKKSKFPIKRSINNGLKSYQKKFQPNRRKKIFGSADLVEKQSYCWQASILIYRLNAHVVDACVSWKYWIAKQNF